MELQRRAVGGEAAPDRRAQVTGIFPPSVDVLVGGATLAVEIID